MNRGGRGKKELGQGLRYTKKKGEKRDHEKTPNHELKVSLKVKGKRVRL